MRKAYTAVLTRTEQGYYSQVPALDIGSQGQDIAETIYMTRDAISLWGIAEEDMGRSIADEDVLQTLKEIHQEEGTIITLIDVDFDEYRRKAGSF
jgi:predicted RNase H-like HicB family nuclease